MLLLLVLFADIHLQLPYCYCIALSYFSLVSISALVCTGEADCIGVCCARRVTREGITRYTG